MPSACSHRSAVGLALLILLRSMFAQVPAAATPPADLDSYVASSMKTFDVPGMAVAIVKDGKSRRRQGIRRAQTRRCDSGRRIHHVRHRIEHESFHHSRARHTGR